MLTIGVAATAADVVAAVDDDHHVLKTVKDMAIYVTSISRSEQESSPMA